ncbi:MAG TPA: phosphatidylserine decarboxylase [Terriglobales bacterium]|nr:phosphatidylserine decarboxylase [Terriglobales bacterium]
MVRDGIYYGVGMALAALLLGWLAGPWYAVPALAAAAFFMWFFRDPERAVPAEAGAVVSPADGKVTDVSTVQVGGQSRHRISIFLSVFDVHVNRSPISGVVRHVEYRRGKFGNAMGAISAEENEQNIVTVEGEGQTVVFKQIAGLLARRIVFTPRVGDQLARGQRVGMIKFGSRVDVILGPGVTPGVAVGQRVRGGASILGQAQAPGSQPRPQSDRVPAGARA